MQYDGLTTAPIATANVSAAANLPHKIAVADAGDSAFDSGVFLSTESLCGEGAFAPMGTFEAGVDGNTVTIQSDARYAISYNWEFGDGATSTQRAPEPHTYTQDGTYTITLDAANNCCTTRFTQTVIIGDATGSNTPAAQTILQVYPNPTINGKVQVQTPNATTLQLYDITGKLLTTTNQSTATFDLSNFGKGIYLVKATLPNGQVYVQKLNY
ncbi:MAG: T9SS type A sorting domain-containing protein [Sphingobacteriales bacterium]|nr:T9SS type A sorting domain-containing protein [Sphingobacteriales bacterium]